MIGHQIENNQFPIEIKPAFHELKVLKHLRKGGITKKFGFSCGYLFQLVFVLIFHHRNWFQLLESAKGESFPGKDAVYRFLNCSRFAWRRFLLFLSAEAVNKTDSLISSKRVSAFVVDDSMFERNRSKSVELLARFKDHARNCYYKGFRMLTLGWSDGHTFIPIDFSLLSSAKSQIQGLSQTVDKRTHGYSFGLAHRQGTDDRTLGSLFLALCDEVGELDWAVALSQLVELVNNVAKKTSKRISKLINRQLQQWIDGLPSYIKAYLTILVWES